MGLLVLMAGLCCPNGLCETATLTAHFADEPADSMVRRLEPRLGCSVALSQTPSDALAQRLRVSTDANGNLTAADPQSGLSMNRKYSWLADPRLTLIETTLANRGEDEIHVDSVSIADWTFRLRDAQDEGYRKLAYRSDVWYGSTFWTGPDWTRVGKNWHHPGINTPAVRRFTAPRDGHLKISGQVFKLDTKPSDGVRLSIRHGHQIVWQAEIDGGDDKGVEANVELDVKAGEAIRFMVHKRGQIYCDTTHWDPTISYADGTSFRASDGFSTSRQGQQGWSYEMQAEGQPELGLPRLRGFASDFMPREVEARVGQPVIFNASDSLPIVVVSDGTDQSGVMMALSGTGTWQFRSELDGDERLRVAFTSEGETGRLILKPGESISLPRVVLGAYSGQWLAGMKKLQRLLHSESAKTAMADLKRQVGQALDRLGTQSGRPPELDLCVMIQAEWRREDELAETPESYNQATARHLLGARKLLADLRDNHGRDFLADESNRLAELAELAERDDLTLEDHRLLYRQIRWLKRRIVLANPLMDFDKLLFTKRVPTSYSHLVMQYYGWRARPGGGIFVLDDPGYSLDCRDILEGRLSHGCVLEPRLSYDARRIVFSFVQCEGKSFDAAKILNDVDEGFYHVWEVNIDGSKPRQLTNGPYDDLMPTYLPDGGIVFSSTRRRGYARCFGGQFSRRWHVYTLHRMDGDGGNLRTISFHDTNEWFPTVSNTGLILYARWDYIDRDAVTHQNLWATRPDGTNPFALWGNATASPHCTFQLQAIPGSPKVVFAASAHHSIAGGSIALVDPTVSDNGQQAITRITPEIPFPEAEGRDIQEYYTSPWPLSEKYFLVGYSPLPLVWEPGANQPNALGIYLLDAWGNRELIYRDPEIGSTNPCPLVPRPVPPALPSMLPDNPQPIGEMVLGNVYEGLGELEPGSIKQLRIVQIFPKTTNLADKPPIGIAREENGRAILGTVPVEPDGSARFLVPAGKLVHFQALDENGFAYQTMRSATYVQPGERVSCVGCHEHRLSAPIRKQAELMALGRPASRIEPGPLGGRPFSFVEVVQPVLDKHCATCHGSQQPDGGIDLTGVPHQGFSKSYLSLCGDVDFWHLGTNPKNAAGALVPRFGGRNQIQITPPGGSYGALGSRLIELIRNGHEEVQLSRDELGRLAAWIDLNAIFYGVNPPEDQARLLKGDLLGMPEIQ